MLPKQRAEIVKIVDEAIEQNKTIGHLKTDVAVLKTDVAVLKADVSGLKTETTGLRGDVELLKGLAMDQLNWSREFEKRFNSFLVKYDEDRKKQEASMDEIHQLKMEFTKEKPKIDKIDGLGEKSIATEWVLQNHIADKTVHRA